MGSTLPVSFESLSSKWYHCVAVFDPVLSKTTLHLSRGSITSNSLGLDGSSNLIRLGVILVTEPLMVA